MTTPLDYVQPGDVISAADFNELIDTIKNLQARVSDLENTAPGASGAVRINSLDPPYQQQVGRLLTINGSNFATPIIDPATGLPRNTVTIGGVVVPAAGFQLVGSNDLRLIVEVPASLDAPPGSLGTAGREFVVSVANPAGSDQRSYRLVSAISAGIPQPSLTGVVGPGGTNDADVGDPTRIQGASFSVNVGDNHVRVFEPGRGIGFGGPGEPPVAVTAATAGEVTFTMPNLFEARPGNPAPFPPLRVTAQVTLTVGATNPVSGTIAVDP